MGGDLGGDLRGHMLFRNKNNPEPTGIITEFRFKKVDTFKALHIWEKQKGGTWKILFDVGFLHETEDPKQNP